MRLFNLENRFQRKPELKEKYHNAMEEYISKGYAEQIPEAEIQSDRKDIYYIPHQAVIKEGRETTKIRIVFDGSRKAKDEKSLNEKLYAGPALQPILNDIILRFRLHNTALVADIQKMFLMIGINEENRDSLRFLWKPRNSEVILHYRNKVLPFGITCSPFLSMATIHHHVEKYLEYSPLASNELRNSMYIDDLITGTETEEIAMQLFKDCNNIMKSAGMNLVKWKSNSTMLNSMFNTEK